MDLTRALAADLRDLAVELTANAYIRETLSILERQLHRQVPSLLGATITATHAALPGQPIQINLVARTIEPAEIAAALLVPLGVVPLGTVAPLVTGRVVYYASSAAAFIELADFLDAALNLTSSAHDQRPELPLVPIHPGITGLEEFSVVNRAVGVLISRGLGLEEARAELERRARRSRTGLPAAAQTLLRPHLG